MAKTRTNAWDKLAERDRTILTNCALADLEAEAQRVGIAYATALYRRSKARAGVKPAPTPILDKWLVLEGDALIIGDPHIPAHDADFINRCYNVGAAWGIRQLLWAGDFYNLDGLSPFWDEVEPPTPEQERKAGFEIFDRAAERFGQQFWCMGNHDARHIKTLLAIGYKFPTAIRMLCPEYVEASPYHFCDLLSAGRKWRVMHPKNASVNPGSVGEKMAAKFRCNVVIAHGHTVGYRRDRSNAYAIIDSGGAFHLDKLAYVSMEPSTRPAMNQGAVIIHQGIGYLLDPLNCDWELLEWAGQRKAK
jgi:hypothetical protein